MRSVSKSPWSADLRPTARICERMAVETCHFAGRVEPELWWRSRPDRGRASSALDAAFIASGPYTRPYRRLHHRRRPRRGLIAIPSCRLSGCCVTRLICPITAKTSAYHSKPVRAQHAFMHRRSPFVLAVGKSLRIALHTSLRSEGKSD